jgi:hypothetical protein
VGFGHIGAAILKVHEVLKVLAKAHARLAQVVEMATSAATVSVRLPERWG